MFGGILPLDHAADLVSVHSGHSQVENNDIRVHGGDKRTGMKTIMSLDDFEITMVHFYRTDNEPGDGLFVINHENFYGGRTQLGGDGHFMLPQKFQQVIQNNPPVPARCSMRFEQPLVDPVRN